MALLLSTSLHICAYQSPRVKLVVNESHNMLIIDQNTSPEREGVGSGEKADLKQSY
jgi:hypothetical protein